MNQTKKTVLLAAVLILILAGAVGFYRYLSKDYTPPSGAIVLPNPDGATDETEAESDNSSETTSESSAETAAETSAETAPPLRTAPDFAVQNTAGETVRLSDYIGKPVIINFWATWCGSCKSELPAFDAAYQAHGEDVHFLMVNLTDGVEETVDKVNTFIADNGYTFPLLFDTEMEGTMTYGVYSIPLTVFVDAKGNLLGGHPGAMNSETLEQYVDILLTYYAEP